MTLIEIHKVPTLTNVIRLQEYGVNIFKSIPTKSALKKAIKKGSIFVNGNLASTGLFIEGGETIELYQLNDNTTKKIFNFSLEVLLEDEHLAVVYKPPGILVSGNSFATINNALPQNLNKSSLFDSTYPRPVHRLDYPTSGLLLIGKTSSSILALNKLFEHKKIQKTYYAITIGEMENNGEISLPIETKKAHTNFTVIESVHSDRFKYLNLVKLQPTTGRKHQLRKHLLSLGNPILGDKEHYLKGLLLNSKGLYLHAATLEFIHPFTKKVIRIHKSLPKKFNKIFPSHL